MSSHKKYCFVIGPIGEDASDVRKHSDQLLKHVITPAVKPLSYVPIRADKISEPGLITSQIMQHIADDPLAIADLTGSNPNVFYELALRHANRKPLVQLICKGGKLPFDVAGMRTIPVDLTYPDSIKEARSEISKQVKTLEGKEPEELDSPVSVAMARSRKVSGSDRRTALTGSWTGKRRQEIGSDGVPFIADMTLDLDAGREPVARTTTHRGMVGTRENFSKCSVSGEFFRDRYLRLTYETVDAQAIQFGTMILELNSDGGPSNGPLYRLWALFGASYFRNN